MAEFNPREYWERRLDEHYDLTGVGDIGYSSAYNEALYDIRAYVFRLLLSRLEISVEDKNVLDVGSGTGFYVDQWHAVGVGGITGSDLTTTAVDQLKLNFPGVPFMELDIGDTLSDSVQGKFDIISAFDVLFHIVDDRRYEQAFNNVNSALKNDGLFIFSDNLLDGVEHKIQHQVSRTKSTVLAFLEKLGFELVLVQPMFVLMNDPVRSSNRWLRKGYSIVHRIASKGNTAGKVLGLCLSPLEKLLLRVVRTGPSTEIYVWRKIGQAR